jgi:hypothetical protein
VVHSRAVERSAKGEQTASETAYRDPLTTDGISAARTDVPITRDELGSLCADTLDHEAEPLGRLWAHDRPDDATRVTSIDLVTQSCSLSDSELPTSR